MNRDYIPAWDTQMPQGISTQTRLLLPTRGLLTLKLTALCGSPLHVHILFEGMTSILPDEARSLGLTEDHVGWVRTVLLNCQQSPLLYARSFIPLLDQHEQHRFLQGPHPFSDLQSLGSQPLGLWLAKQQDLIRSPFRFAYTPACYWPYWSTGVPSDWLAARQSMFQRQHAKLLLTEVFLSNT